MVERRRYYRLKDGVKVVYKVSGKLGEINSSVFDVGGGGLCLPISQKIGPGTNLELNLLLPDNKDSFFAFARVVWQEKAPQKDKNGQNYYNTGIEFLKVDLKNRLQIIHYVHTSLKERVKGSNP